MSRYHYKKTIAENGSPLSIPAEAIVEVYISGTNTLAQIYDARVDGSLLLNPYTVNDGIIDFYVEPGLYDITATVAGNVMYQDDYHPAIDPSLATGVVGTVAIENQFQTKDQLKAASPALRIANVTDEYQGGRYVFDFFDMTHEVNIDPKQGFILPPDSDPSGGSGAWVLDSDIVYAETFGARPEVDCSDAVQFALDFAKEYGIKKIKIFRDETKVAFLDGQFQLEASNLVFDVGRVYCGRDFRAIMSGQSGELDVTSIIDADAVDGDDRFTLPDLADVAKFPVGSKITVRGKRNGATGKPLRGYKQEYFVIAHDGLNIVLNERIDTGTADGFLVQYVNPDYLTNFGEENVTRIYLNESILLSASAVAGEDSVIVDTSNVGVLNALKPGDVVVISDTVSPQDYSAYYRTSGAYLHEQCNRIVSIDTVSGTVYLESPLDTPMDATRYASITRLRPVRNSRITNMQCVWVDKTLNFSNALEIVNGENCHADHIFISGRNGYSWHRHAARLTNCIDSSITDFVISDARYSGGGEGYGAVMYGSTRCLIDSGKTYRCRHDILLNRSSSNNIVSNVDSYDAHVSNFDAHGGNTNNNKFIDCKATFGETEGGAQEFNIDSIVDNLDGTATINLSSLAFTSVTTLTDKCYINNSATDIPIFGFISPLGFVTLNFAKPHRFSNGDNIDVYGQPTPAYNGSFVVVASGPKYVIYDAKPITIPGESWIHSDNVRAVNPDKNIDGYYDIVGRSSSPLSIDVNIASVPAGIDFDNAWLSMRVGYSKAAYRFGNPTHFYGDRDSLCIRCAAIGFESDSTDVLVDNDHSAFDIQAGCYNVKIIDADVLNCQKALSTLNNTKSFAIARAATFVSYAAGEAIFNIDNSDNSIRIGNAVSFDGTGDFTSSDYYKVIAESDTQITIEAATDPTAAGISNTVSTQPYLYIRASNIEWHGTIRRTRPELDSVNVIDVGSNNINFVSNVKVSAHFVNVNNYPKFVQVDGVKFTETSYEFNPVVASEVGNLSEESYPSNLAGSWSLDLLEYACTVQACTGVIINKNDFDQAPRGVVIQNCPSAKIVANQYAGMLGGVVLRGEGGNTGAVFEDNDLYGCDSAAYSGSGGEFAELQTLP